jgi:hypothetical protein
MDYLREKYGKEYQEDFEMRLTHTLEKMIHECDV